MDKLPQEMNMEIMKRLPITDLRNLLTSNKRLYHTYMPKFSEDIEDFKEDLRYRREVAGPKYIERIERLHVYIHDYIKDESECIVINDQLVRIMNLEHMPKINGQTVFCENTLSFWWLTYIIDNRLVNVKVAPYTNGNTLMVTLDNLIADLVKLPLGSQISFFDLTNLISEQHTEYSGAYLSTDNVYYLSLERFELYQMAFRWFT